MDRIVDIGTDGRHLSAERGFMVVSQDRAEVGRIALDEIAGVIVHAHGITYSNNLLVALSKQGAVLVVCAPNHAPVVALWPLEGHHIQAARMRDQIAASKPTQKRLWRDIVICKLKMQQSVLQQVGQDAQAFDTYIRKVRSGDPDNMEAQAARRYWQSLMGSEFRRDRNRDDNALLNYGYTVIRSVVARSIVAAGLHPTLALFHSNRSNAFALADDLMEPYRPLVDFAVYHMIQRNETTLTPKTKQALVRLIGLDIPLNTGVVSPLSVSAQKLAHSLSQCFASKDNSLILPQPLSALEFSNFVRVQDNV